MATDKATLAYRPDAVERAMLSALVRKYGGSMSRMIGQAVREKAEREGFTVEEMEKSAANESGQTADSATA